MASRYRQDMQRAWRRIAAIPTGKLETRLGRSSTPNKGRGLPVLVCHGVFGCHADPVDGRWTRMLGERYRVIAPSRFGYFGSTLPPQATPADQAEVYGLLLNRLGIDRAAVVAYSAGSASALELALRHPDRVVGLVLANCRLGGSTPNRLLKPIQSAVYGWERLWWLYRKLLPATYGRAADDHWARQTYAVTAAGRISGAKLVTIDRGGHLFLGHDAQVRTAIRRFIQSVAQPERRPT